MLKKIQLLLLLDLAKTFHGHDHNDLLKVDFIMFYFSSCNYV